MAAGTKTKSKSNSAEAVDEPIVLDGDENEVVEDGEEEDEEDEEDEEEGEYEVQAIVAHKMNSGKYEYLVSWKGYGPEHNTWEPEAHVSHARDIVQRYWDSQPKSAPVTQRKRGRPSSSSSPAVSSQRAAKTPRANGNGNGNGNVNGNGKGKNKKKAISPDVEDELLAFENTHMDSLAKYEDVPDWEDLVESIETIERNSKNELMVFMTMTGGEKTGQPTEVAYKRCPQKILKFYEAHLKWKMTE